SLGGFQSLGDGTSEAQPGDHLRALRGRWAPACRRHQLRERRGGSGARGGAGDPARVGNLGRILFEPYAPARRATTSLNCAVSVYCWKLATLPSLKRNTCTNWAFTF